MKEEESEEEEKEKEEGDNNINDLITEQFQNNNNQKINIFFTSQKGFRKNIVSPTNLKVKDLFIKYIIKLGLDKEVIGKSIFFLFNGLRVDHNEEKNVGEFFRYNGSNVIVIDTKDIIGA